MTAEILLVDDEPKNLYALSAVLESLPVSIRLACSGEEALRRVLERDFAAILLDVRMPGIDGFETAALIRARERCRDVPIFFLSALSDRRAGGDDYYLVKPVEPDVVLALVAAALRRPRPTL